MTAKRKLPKRTPEEIERSERITQMLQERIAYYEDRLQKQSTRRRWFRWRIRIERVN